MSATTPIKPQFPTNDARLQAIYDTAEDAADALHLADGCAAALLVVIDRMASEGLDLQHTASALLLASRRYMVDVAARIDDVARLTMDQQCGSSWSTE
mgnify:CR=1 FL=1